MKRKKDYQPPHIEVIELEHEGVIASSNGMSLPGVGDGGSALSSGSAGNHGYGYNAAGANELDELINGILTFEE